MYNRARLMRTLETNIPGKEVRTKGELIEELTDIRSCVDTINCKEDVLFVESRIGDIENRYEFSYWNGRGELNGSEEVFELINHITFCAFKLAEHFKADITIAHCKSAEDYQALLERNRNDSKLLKASLRNTEARQELIKSKVGLNPIYAENVDHIVRNFLFKFATLEIEGLTRDKIRWELLQICKKELEFFASVLNENILDITKCDYVNNAIWSIVHFRAVYEALR